MNNDQKIIAPLAFHIVQREGGWETNKKQGMGLGTKGTSGINVVDGNRETEESYTDTWGLGFPEAQEWEEGYEWDETEEWGPNWDTSEWNEFEDRYAEHQSLIHI